MRIEWIRDEEQPQMIALYIEERKYGCWHPKWVRCMQTKQNFLPTSPSIVQWVRERERELGWKEALDMLARRTRFSTEIKKRLVERGCSAASVDEVLCKCHKAGYINDEDRALRQIEVWRKKGYGPLRIRMELKKLGVAHPTCLYDDKEKSMPYLKRYLEKKLPVPASREQKAKVIRSLLRRGYPLDMINAVLRFSAELD